MVRGRDQFMSKSKIGAWCIARVMHNGTTETQASGYETLAKARAAARRASGMFPAKWKLQNDETGESIDYENKPRTGRLL